MLTAPIDKKYVTLHNNVLAVFFPKDPDTVDVVRTLPRRQFVSRANPPYWTAKLCPQSLLTLYNAGFTFSPEIRKIWSRVFKNKPQSEIEYGEFDAVLRPFQKQAVKRTVNQNGNILLAMDMGLGKTLTSLAYLQLNPSALPAVVVCPSSVKYAWKREAEKWTTLSCHVLEGRQTNDVPPATDVLVLNYEILINATDAVFYAHCKCKAYTKCEKDAKSVKCRKCGKTLKKVYRHSRELKQTGWVDHLLNRTGTLVIDEAHYCKNPDAWRTKACQRLSEHAEHVIELTGRPVMNQPNEIFYPVRMIDDTIFPDHLAFAKRYCDATKTRFGWNFNGASNTDELHSILSSTVMLRQRKCDVLDELPEKQRCVIPLVVDNAKEYVKAECNFAEWLKENDENATSKLRAKTLAQFGELKKLAWQGKQREVVNWIHDYLADNDKLVVFTWHREALSWLYEHTRAYGPVRIEGGVDSATRADRVDTFQNDPDCRLLLANIEAGSHGLTLTAANAVAFAELAMSPGLHDEAEDRVHRMTQEHDSVFAYYLIADDTIENKICSTLDRRRQVVDAVLDGEDTDSSDLLTEIVESIKQEV